MNSVGIWIDFEDFSLLHCTEKLKIKFVALAKE